MHARDDASPEQLTTPTWIDQYYQYTSTEAEGNNVHNRQRLAQEHRRLSQTRQHGESLVNMLQDETSTTLLITTDDMSYLVSSITAEIAAHYGGIATLNHPTFIAERDHNGTLISLEGTGVEQPVVSGDTAALPVLDQKTPSNGNTLTVESWISIQLIKTLDPQTQQELTTRIHQILKNVRSAVTDADAMAQHVRTIAQQLSERTNTTQQTFSAHDPIQKISTAQEFLNWLTEGNFLFWGMEERRINPATATLETSPQNRLGIFTQSQEHHVELPDLDITTAYSQQPLHITKAYSRSTIHRHEYLDYIGVSIVDDSGAIIGEHVILGLFSAQAYTLPATQTPLIRERINSIRHRLGFHCSSHSEKTLTGMIEQYPRTELFHTNVETLSETFRAIMGLEERRLTRVFIRPDSLGQFICAVIFLPRDRYNTGVRQRIESVFCEQFDVADIDYDVRLSTSSLARLFLRIRLNQPNTTLEINTEDIQQRVQRAVRSWSEATASALEKAQPEDKARTISQLWADAVPATYRADYSVEEAVNDVDIFEELSTQHKKPVAVRLYTKDGQTRLKTYLNSQHTLTELLPVMQNMGLIVIDQRPYRITPADGRDFILYDFGVVFPEGIDAQEVVDVYEQALSSFLQGRRETDTLDRLILKEKMSWKYVTVLRAYTHYLGQLGCGFTPEFMSDTLLGYPAVTSLLNEFFAISFDPKRQYNTDEEREQARQKTWEELLLELGKIPTLDADRFMRSMATVIAATLRTNAYLPDEFLALKVSPEYIDFAPLPRPKFEIYVYSPRVEGVHLRFGSVARGGLRWSDRREDFRTEVLGLVKAQMVKNAVIIPTGAKGGFFPKQLPSPAQNRDAWIAEGRESYKIFIRALLSVTDNLRIDENGVEHIIRPEGIIARDADDYYLVVAADKGTAAFSDTANSISEEYGFWLGDAFASGGSIGYDHKAMGITAKGAWESVKRHFAELGKDCQQEEFTAVGIGDMSGDVFGNGMMRTQTVKLLAAFDHRDIFLDPNPDPETSFKERVRLYELPRSSWQDYDRSLISEGGGVYSRDSKSIPLTPQVRSALGIDEDITEMSPPQLLSAILKAPVELIYNGGIGTYIKSSAETHAEVGDKTNDALRINGCQVRATIIGEGGNLGMTQRGRIEAAEAGVLLNTDAIDNSAGVETSDREVNIKILIDRLIAQGKLSPEERATFIEAQREDVGQQVLETNREQNVLLQAERHGVIPGVSAYIRLIHDLEKHAGLVREVEFIPDDEHIRERYEQTGITLTSPEFSVLTAYVKMHLTAELCKTSFAEDPYLHRILQEYFPPALVERFGEDLNTHPLRQEIICTRVANQIVNTAGITHVFRVQEETGASVDTIARAFFVARDLFDIDKASTVHRGLPAHTLIQGWQATMRDWQRVLDRLVRWFISERSVVTGAPILDIINTYSEVLRLRRNLPDYLSDNSRARVRALREQGEQWGLPEELLVVWIRGFEGFALMDVVRTAQAHQLSVDAVALIYFSVYDRFGVDSLLTLISRLPRTDRWEILARSALRDDLYEIAAGLALAILKAQGENASARSVEQGDSAVQQWVKEHPVRMERVDDTLAEVVQAATGSDGRPRFDVLSVALRALRGALS
ncbi:NAD-glutamate dehydrogenase [Rothia sp. CCM 9419]|uniref:NAD-glutamate dehydrogenase n=1 Tax=Rothia sp. CCM 9419 TaxID=3402662 RepID=UPI003AED7B4A